MIARTYLWAFALLLALAGCNSSGDNIDRVQTNLVDKRMFEGDWWYTRTNIDVDGDEANASLYGVFQGNMSYADLGIDKGQSLHMARIRWVIDEDFLYAYRSYELIQNGNDDSRDPDFMGQPLAAFAIEDHVDVRYDYNGITGELSNVRVENTNDRRWYERRYMRVDWSQNMITPFYVGAEGGGSVESAPFFFQEGAHDEFPKSWEPQFVRVRQERKKDTDDPSRYRWVDEWPANADSIVHYMSFVTQELYSPGALCLSYNIPCQTAALTIRNSFLRVPPEHEYAVETETNAEFDRFGTFRTYQRTYVRGGKDRETLHERCERDNDCGVGGKCNTDTHICVGGLTSDFGETDFLAFYRPRHNFWAKSFDDRECIADWECDNRYGDEVGDNGKRVDRSGSLCDKAARRCTVPIADRETRPVAYHLNAGFPRHLVKDAFRVIGDWNEVFMRGQRALEGKKAPNAFNREPVACQTANPTDYCYCGSAEDTGGTCAWTYDPFRSPEEDADLAGSADDENFAEPYDCHIQAADGYEDPAHPESYDDYQAPGVYGYHFVGSECLFLLHANSCDRDPSLPCEDLGDIRYQFFNYIAHGNVGFGGVSLPMVDPTTGELITANANVAATSVESVATQAVDFFPVLRCNGEKGCAKGEEGANDRYFSGDNLRQYFANQGRVERPVGIAASGTDGYSNDNEGRPGIPVDLRGHILKVIAEKQAKIDTLQGVEGRAQIYSDRMTSLAGTSVESKLLASLGLDGQEAMTARLDPTQTPNDAKLTDPGVLAQVSPFRMTGSKYLVHPDDALWQELSAKNIDPPFDAEQRSRYWEYWAEAFRGTPVAEASIRMQQIYLRAVMRHEVGHSVGLRHNFAGSFDRDNYFDGYFNVAEAAPLPRLADFDKASKGGNGDGKVLGAETTAYLEELRRVRDLRAKAGAGNTMTGSIMDYNGDLSDFSNGLGRYDVAASLWNHFGLREAFVGNPVQSSNNSLDGVRRSDQHERVLWSYYPGGGTCSEDADCPYAKGSAAVSGQPLYQRCVKNPRKVSGAVACGGDEDCLCSGFDEDFDLYVTGAEYRTPSGDAPFHPVPYLFCTDDRVVDISWCSRFDAGESFQEAIDHYRRQWQESYPRSYYRRFRGQPAVGLTRSGIVDAAKVFQHFFYRLYYESGFQQNQGPLGLDDQYQASIDAMNWLAEIVQMPQSGTYKLNGDGDVYEFVSDDPEAAGADLSLGVGMGYPLWSQYQDGFYGFFRTERSGVFFDKYYALLALALRDWNLSFTIDERFYINFYDLFAVEMEEFFGGMILNDPRWYAPRVDFDGGEAKVRYLSWYRDAALYRRCSDDLGNIQPCRGSQVEEELAPAIGNTSNDVLRSWATILALAQFPVFYDTSFEQRLSVFKRGNGDGFDIPDVQPDGDPTCAYGTIKLDPSHDTGCEDPDYVVFDSDRFRTQYVAVKVRTRLAYNLDEEQIGFELLKRLVDKQDELHTLEAIVTPTNDELARIAALESELNRENSFLEYLIEVQRQYGISSYISY